MNASELAAILPQGSLFSACRADELADLLALSTRHDMKKGQTLLLQGDPGDQVLILLSGNAKVTMVAMNGREITLDYADAGALLGEIAVLDGGERSASVIALSSGSYLRLSRAAFEAFIERQPGVAWRLLKELARRLRQTNSTVESDRAFSSGPRLARFLQRLMLSETATGRLRLDLSQAELGAFAGMSRENINRQLSAWADAGIIALEHGQIRVRDSGFLAEIAASSD
ncbi:MAG: Crp/Fnr family transcriptional regulator [Sphingomonadales bacterium]|jgi:CRP/FNR family cyclic AMP-dependent transcriptional regulator|nr:Crp/Fnr family transcriptional regulator [Sphingomonadales bacterium]MBK6719700.1 Crp/Fnr family transcriptional regulator [Sphingomonadales bacterium]MBK8861246.1 Crp/Fnr family transcriptional regulator [Sphingomonadales bacterium]